MTEHKPATEPQELIAVDDPVLQSLLPGYLERRLEDLPRICAAVEAGDFETLRTVGHNLSGSGGAYGMAQVSELGRALERAAAAHDRAGVDAAAAKLAQYLGRVRIA